MNTILTPCILQTIIICCTIIIITIIAVSAYRIKKGQQRSWGAYIYYASILSIFTISIFGACFYGNRNVLDFVSLASALISIILAIITIIYSFYSNSQSASQVETLNKAAESVKRATTSYAESAESLQDNISKIITAVNRVEEKTDRLLDMTSISGAGASSGTNNHLVDFDLDAYIKGYVNLASPIGIMAMYACIKAKDTKREWNLNIFPNEYNRIYCGGFLISTTSAGFITVDVNFSNGNVIVANYLQNVKKYILEWLESFDFTKIEGLQSLKDSIDSYFDNPQ